MSKQLKQKIKFLTCHHEDICDELIVCPNCGKVVKYGETMMHSGYTGCHECFDTLSKRIEKIKSMDYDMYVNFNLYALTKQEYEEICLEKENNTESKTTTVDDNANHCIYCNKTIPEGGWICNDCIQEYFKKESKNS